jgi:hypothetical protein
MFSCFLSVLFTLMARTKQTARSSDRKATDKPKGKGKGKRPVSDASVGKSAGVKKVKKEKKPDVATIASDLDVPRFLAQLFRSHNNTMANPTEEMIQVLKTKYPQLNRNQCIALCTETGLTDQALQTHHDYTVTYFMRTYMAMINAWNARKRRGKTISTKAVNACIGSMHGSYYAAIDALQAAFRAVALDAAEGD